MNGENPMRSQEARDRLRARVVDSLAGGWHSCPFNLRDVLGLLDLADESTGDGATNAFDAIATLCGCPAWDYPGQIVRDVESLVADRDEARGIVSAERQRAAGFAAECRRLNERLCWYRATPDELTAARHAITAVAASLARAGNGAASVALTAAADRLHEAWRMAADERDEATGRADAEYTARHATEQELDEARRILGELDALLGTGCNAALTDAVEELARERDEARANYQWMVERAADRKIDGYRELGQRAADAENERDEARAELAKATANNARRNLALDALHYVWCSGGCDDGVYRSPGAGPVTEELAAEAERHTARLRAWLEASKERSGKG